ncbi:MAG: hypothetical protein KBT27_03450 [Prevotellaceae bacterium]|nr:hypothetical protein [Candidatus Faecinaster equi]
MNYQEPQMPANNGQQMQNYFNQQNFYRPQYQQQMNCGMIWVQGEAAARAYPLAPSTSIILWDSDSDVFYRKTSNAQGKPISFDIYDYRERPVQKDENQNVALDSILKEIKAINARIDKLEISKQKNQNVRKDNNHGQSNV